MQPRVTVITLGVNDLARAVIVNKAWASFWGGYAGSFQDPDQHLWEVVWNPHWNPA